MEFRKVESARRAKLQQREAAAQAAPPPPAEHYSWISTAIWCAVEGMGYVWLNVFPLLALVAGVVFIFLVEQTHELLGNLRHDLLYLGVLAAWAAAIWYSMRVLSTTDFPGDAAPHPAAKGFVEWLNVEAPRVAPYTGLAIIACASSVFLTGDPSPHWIAPLAAGVVPLTWGVALLANRATGYKETHVYRWSALGSALLAALVGFYAWSSVPQPMRSEPEALDLGDWLVGACVALTFAPLLLRRTGTAAHWLMTAALAVWVWIVYLTASHHPGARLPFNVLLLAAFGLWFTEHRRRLLKLSTGATPQFEVGRGTFVALGIALALQAALVIALMLSPITLGMGIGTLGLLFLALTLFAFFGIVWVFLPKYLTLPSMALVPLVWVMFFGNAPDHALSGTDFARAPERPRLQEHFQAWSARLPKRDDAPVFFVAAAGGGLRAAYWTATMLASPDDHTCGEFGRHVYAYSGVSGGSLGIAAYLAQRQVWEAKPPLERCKPGRRAEMSAMLERDFLAPVAGSLLFSEMVQRFVPFDYLKADRGTTLARAWSTAWDDVFPETKGRFDRPFLEVFDAQGSPAVFLNATAVDSGRRAIAMNVVARIPDAVDTFRPVRGLALQTNGLTLREAVLNSARFTYVSPAGTVLGCRQPAANGECGGGKAVLWDRLVDGGYFENSGLATLTDVIAALEQKDQRRLHVVVIDNSNDSEPACGRSSGADGNEEVPPGVPALSGLTAPMEALLHVREARGMLEVRRLRTEFSCRGQILDWNLFGDQKERREAQAAGQEPALGWFLSRRSARWIDKRAREVAARFPFRHAGCPGPVDRLRPVVGDSAHTDVPCGQ